MHTLLAPGFSPVLGSSKSSDENNGRCGCQTRLGLGPIDPGEAENGFGVLGGAPALPEEPSDPVPRGIVFALVVVASLAMFVSFEALLEGMFLTGNSLKSIMLLPVGSLPLGLLCFECLRDFIFAGGQVALPKVVCICLLAGVPLGDR